MYIYIYIYVFATANITFMKRPSRVDIGVPIWSLKWSPCPLSYVGNSDGSSYRAGFAKFGGPFKWDDIGIHRSTEGFQKLGVQIRIHIIP